MTESARSDDEETSLGTAADETIAVPHAATTSASATDLAWSENDAAPPVHERRPLPKSLLGLLAAVVVGAIGLLAFLFGQHSSRPAAPAQMTSQSPIALPPPSTVSTSQPHGYIDDQDRVFISTIARDDWFSSVPRADLISSAHVYCTKANAGPESKAEAANGLLKVGMSLEHATNFMYAATVAYCPNQLSGVQ